MKYFASVSATSFTFSFAMWVIWSYFIMQANLNPSWDGSLIYLPHAARVLCVVYFGYKSIPALYLAEICGPLFFFPTIPDLQMLFLAMLSVLSVPFALFILSLMGFSLGNTRQSPLNKRYYRHIALIVMISAMFNALGVNLFLSQFDVNYFGKVADVVQVARFFIGDMLGAATIIIILSITLKPLIAKPLRNSD
jgi:hypothetical protein|tara:strand:- start:2180 stop:2761 length:582 start_codon:yes stop_codon:yes gene_type:complete